MGLLERIESVRRPSRAWPVGPAMTAPGPALSEGHDDGRFSPESYGDYLATSNEVYAAAQLRARLAGSVRPLLYAGRDAEKTLVTGGPVRTLLDRVNPFWTWPRLARMDELCMCLWGESVWALEPGSSAMGPGEIWWLKPSQVQPVVDERSYLRAFLYKSASGEDIRFEPDEIVWFRYPNPLDEFSPLAPMAAARLAADTGRDMMLSNRNLFSQGLQLGGIVVPSAKEAIYTEEQARELEATLQRRYSGKDKAHRWAVLRFDAEMKAMGVTPKDAEFVAGLNLTMRQVANAFGIPAPLLNDLEHATLANLREFQKALWEHALAPDLEFRAAEIEEQLLPRFSRQGRGASPDHVTFDFSGVAALQESITSVWDRERQAIEVGALTINEQRERHGLPAVAWGDVWWAPVNKAPVTDVESWAPPAAASVADDAEEEDEADREFAAALEALRAPRVQQVERDEHGRVLRVVEQPA